MADKKFTQLPPATVVTDTDIFAQTQDISTTAISRKVTSLIYWQYILGKTLSNAGNPTGSVAGTLNQLCFDTTNNIIYICTATGTAGTAVWSRNSDTFIYAGNPNGVLAGQTYDLCYDSSNTDFYICTTSGTAPVAVWTSVTPTIASPLPLSKGGTSKSLTADNGAIVYCDSNSFELLAHVTTAGKILQSGNASAPTWSTPTYPSASGTAGQILRSDATNNVYSTSTFADTYGVSTLLYASSANTITGLATANNGVLVTSAGGVPSIGSTLPNAVQDNITRLGTVTSGIWHATTIGEIYGGTAQSTYTTGDILYSSASNTLSKLSGNITTGKQYLSQTGSGAASAAPAWSTVTGSDITGAALTRTDDTNVTLTLGGTPTTALLRAASLTLGWTGQLALTRGGTAASLTADNGAIAYSTGSSLALLASTATASKMLLSGSSAAPTWSTSTIPTSAGATANKVLLSDGTNYVLSTPTFPNASATAGKFIRSDGTNWIASTPTLPTSAGTSGKVLQSDGTNYIESTPTYPSASGTAGKILRADGTNNVYSTSTFADTYTASNLLYSNGSNTVTGLATGNNKMLITNGSGVPSMGATYNTGTFTPAVTFGGGSTGQVYSVQSGEWQQVGNIVYGCGRFSFTNKGSSTGAAVLTGLPVSTAGGSGFNFSMSVFPQNFTLVGTAVVLDFNRGDTTANIYSITSGGGAGAYDNTHFSNSTQFDFMFWYFAA